MSASTRMKFELLGWLVFVVSAIFFVWAGVRAGDVVSTLGAVLFLFACFFFLVPVIPMRWNGALRRDPIAKECRSTSGRSS